MKRSFLEDMFISALFFMILRVGILLISILIDPAPGSRWSVVSEQAILGPGSYLAGLGLMVGALTASLRLRFMHSIASVISGVALGALAYYPAYTQFVYGQIFMPSFALRFFLLGIESVAGALGVLLLARMVRARRGAKGSAG